MTWEQTRQQALDKWQGIRDSIGTADTLDLLIEINSVFSLCEKARQEAAGEAPKCTFCVLYRQYGGCLDISAEMSERVVEKDWIGLRAEVDRFLAHLTSLRLPPNGAPLAMSDLGRTTLAG